MNCTFTVLPESGKENPQTVGGFTNNMREIIKADIQPIKPDC